MISSLGVEIQVYQSNLFEGRVFSAKRARRVITPMKLILTSLSSVEQRIMLSLSHLPPSSSGLLSWGFFTRGDGIRISGLVVTQVQTRRNDHGTSLVLNLITCFLFVVLQGWFEMAKEYFRPVLGGTVIDASCGSGLFSRSFAKSRLFSLVVALDYSEAMLKQCLEFINEEQGFPKENLTLVRADISRLPFVAGSIDAVHAGAALHCWPSPSAAVAEISRVLRPGGVFVATTTVADGSFSLIPFLQYYRESVVQFVGGRLFLSEREMEDLCRSCGLVDFKCVRNRFFIMLSARKPN